MTSQTGTKGHRWRRGRVALVIAAALGLAAPMAPAHAEDAIATVRGTVVGIDGSADTHAEVTISPEGGGSVLSSQVDADGTFEITGIEPGSYYIRARDVRHNVDAVYTGAGWNGSESEPGYHDAVEISAGTTEVAFELPYLQGVIVQALDETGTPFNSGISLWIERYDSENDRWLNYGMDPPGIRDDGRGFVPTSATQDTVRICVHDATYNRDHRPTHRYGTSCWENGDSIEDATPITVGEDDRKIEITIPLEIEGLSIWRDGPVAHGRVQIGETVTVEPNRWEPADVQLSYQWETLSRVPSWEFEPVPGATGPTFTPTADLDGQELFVRIIAEAEGYATTEALLNPGTVGAVAPTVESFELHGTAIAGETVTADVRGVTPADADVEVWWYADGALVAESPELSLEITEELSGAEIGAFLRVYHDFDSDDGRTGATLTLFDSVSAPEVAVGTVTLDAPFLPQVRDTVSVHADGWDPEATLSYQWYRGDSPISGATRPFYSIKAADEGYSLSVEVTATVPGIDPVSVRSAQTRAVGLGGVVTRPGTGYGAN